MQRYVKQSYVYHSMKIEEVKKNSITVSLSRCELQNCLHGEKIKLKVNNTKDNKFVLSEIVLECNYPERWHISNY